MELTAVPRDGRLLALILASKGISDADDRVIHQLLDFAHRESLTVPLPRTCCLAEFSLACLRSGTGKHAAQGCAGPGYSAHCVATRESPRSQPYLCLRPLYPFIPLLPALHLNKSGELTPGYTADVLSAAQQLADHAGRTGPQANRIEKEDVELAIQMRRRHEFVEQPPRDVSVISNRLSRTSSSRSLRGCHVPTSIHSSIRLLPLSRPLQPSSSFSRGRSTEMLLSSPITFLPARYTCLWVTR